MTPNFSFSSLVEKSFRNELPRLSVNALIIVEVDFGWYKIRQYSSLPMVVYKVRTEQFPTSLISLMDELGTA